MSYINIWIGIPEADHNELNNRRGTENNVGPAKQFVTGQLDPDTVQPLYAQRTAGPNTWHLWSVILDSKDGAFNHQVNAFRQEFPGAQLLGAWNQDGSQYGCRWRTVVTENPAYQGAPLFIDNPQYQPDPGPGLEPAPDFDPRRYIKNPDHIPQFITTDVHEGTPVYSIPNNLSAYMPEGDTTVRDVHLPAGWSPRNFDA